MLLGGFGLGVVALFLPWWGYSYNASSDLLRLLDLGSPTGSTNGFTGWGNLYLVAVIAGSLLVLLRALARDRALDIPVADWFIYLACAGFMLIGALAVADAVIAGSYGFHVAVDYGFWVALIGAILVLFGALRDRAGWRYQHDPTSPD